MQPSSGHSKVSKTDKIRAAQIAAFLQQCYELQKTFGKEPENLETAVKAFCLVLDDCSSGDIQSAFTEWLKTKEEIPTPANIRNLCIEIEIRREERLALKSNVKNLPAPRIEVEPVPWANMHYSEITQDLNLWDMLTTHMANLGPKRADYAKYLVGHCGFPENFRLQHVPSQEVF